MSKFNLPTLPEDSAILDSHFQRNFLSVASRATISNRTNSVLTSYSRATSVAASVHDIKQKKLNLWPEWVDAEDVTAKNKEKEKSKNVTFSQNIIPGVNYFDDPEGKIEMPSNIKVAEWKRPPEIILDFPVLVEPEKSEHFYFDSDINKHAFKSETNRWIASQITYLFNYCKFYNLHCNNLKEDKAQNSLNVSPIVDTLNDDVPLWMSTWRPWEHIYAMNKIVKGPHFTPYNPNGKYAVKLYWLGSYRKIIVDDTIPVDSNGNVLLLRTQRLYELWPIILNKALLKIASLEESDKMSLWNTMLDDITEYKQYTPPRPESTIEMVEQLTLKVDNKKIDRKETKVNIKDDKKKSNFNIISTIPYIADKSNSYISEDFSLLNLPKKIYMASYFLHSLKEESDVVKRQPNSKNAQSIKICDKYGLKYRESHPVLITRVRKCPLGNIAPKLPTPKWKLIRPRNEDNINDDVKIKSVEICSIFLLQKEIEFDPNPIISRKISTNTVGSVANPHVTHHRKLSTHNQANRQAMNNNAAVPRKVSSIVKNAEVVEKMTQLKDLNEESIINEGLFLICKVLAVY
ncbi:hypothetical protein A3Q56_01326 [Intoshia linei]|uniref:Calpain catalytic domain-containing protein n=1 Tax=Intoshia linei TaxID=1819745 RepID=A0A177B9I5_9BILA|nr:hypothetical protein A3Q56_01326 [Intoshia linei]